MVGSWSRVHRRTVLRGLAGDGRGAVHEDSLHHPVPDPGHPLPRPHDKGLLLPPGASTEIVVILL